MKAEVIKAYKDRITGDLHLRGAIVDVTDARAKELSEGGFVKIKEAAKPTTRKAAAKTK